jgi:prepilin-type N-terminal cleavage/methylation domain-containing protein
MRGGTARLSDSSGFTLLEIMVATTILTIIMSFVYFSFSNSMNIVDSVDKRNDVYQSGRQLINLMSREMESAYLIDHDPNSSESLRNPTFFIGTRDSHGGREMDKLRFTTLSHVVVAFEDTEVVRESEHCEVEYSFSVDYKKDNVSLTHREDFGFRTEPMGFTKYGKTFELTDNLKEFTLKYFDGKEWLDTWDSEEKKDLPVAIDMSIILADENGKEVKFATMIDVPLRNKK